MKTKINYEQGQVLGDYGIVYIRDTGKRIFPSYKRGLRYALFKCRCGNEFETAVLKIKNGHTKSCGCHKIKVGKEVNLIHGLSGHKLFKKWGSIKERIYNPNVLHYKDYGGRGIKLYEPWINDAKSFIKYCMTLPGWDNPNLKLDRINNEGNYEPGNLRFTTNYISILNRRRHKSNTSGHEGVSFDITHNEWQSYTYKNYKKITLYRGKSKELAIKARRKYFYDNNLIQYKPLNNQ